ncbi:hypothetical protein ACFXKX_26700 [Streptomyces scopuliridis]|uniref:hypothetical protein n=1 Tax=Streptomyces scopuliridis TaxID=452529 RepID=UPI0036AC837B
MAIDSYDGWVGSDLNHACRLLDADVLRDALRERSDDFVLCVSEQVHAGIVRHDHPGIPAADFHPVTVDSKNGPLPAWLHGPVPKGKAGAPAKAEAGARAGALTAVASVLAAAAGARGGTADTRPTAAFDLPGAHFGGGLVTGDNHGISAGRSIRWPG